MINKLTNSKYKNAITLQSNNKVLNSKCICKKGLNWINKEVIMLEPCEHMLHFECFLHNKNNNKCSLCDQKIIKYYTEEDLFKLKDLPIYYQKYVDLTSVKNINYLSKCSTQKFIYNIPNLLGILSKIPFAHGYDDGIKICRELLCLVNAKLIIIGQENL